MNNFTFLRTLVRVTLAVSSTIIFLTVSHAQIVRPYGMPIYSDNLHGGHTMFGNSILAMHDAAGSVDLAKMNDFGSYSNGTTSQYLNDNSDMEYIDVDGSGGPATTLIAPGSAWSYSNAASAPAGWPVVSATLPGGPGNAPLGYGPTGSVGTTLADIRTYYFEKKVVMNPSSYGSFTFNLTVDDGAVVYVNGTEVGRVNMPAGAVSFTTNASSNLEPEQSYSFTVGAGAPFINGTNSITVEVHTSASNESGTDDLFFDLQLQGNASNITSNSSSADLVIPSGSTIKFARVYWGGRIKSGDGGADNINLRSVKIRKGSGSYSSITAPSGQIDKTLISGSDSAYQAYVDVTSYLALNGAGTYTLADLKVAAGSIGSGGYFGGWSMVVVYENPALPYSSVRVYDGYLQVYNGGSATTQSITLNGLNAPATPLSASDAYLSVMAWEGDAGLAASSGNPNGDFLRVNGTMVSNGVNPAVNMWNGTISKNGTHVTTKNPDYKNQFGIDIDDQIEVGVGYGIAANATSVNVEFGTEADQYFPSVFAFTMLSKDPAVTLDKTVSDNLQPLGVLQTSETLTYTLSGSNTGVGPAVNAMIVDTLPASITYVAGSMEIISSPGGIAGLKSDASGDDQAFQAVDVAGNEYVKFYIGSGASSSSGGTLQPGESYSVSFKAISTSNLNELSTVTNTARIFANSVSGEPYTDDGTAVINPAGGPLPVKLSEFSVKKSSGNALLKWVTQSEVKNDGFAIEKSVDGINFTKVGYVKGNGTTNNVNYYQFEDVLNNSLKVIYYRLRVVDIDGKSSYSKVIALRADGLVVNNIVAYPNPFTDHVKLQISAQKEENVEVRFNNLYGQTVIKRMVTLQAGQNIVVLKDLNKLGAGTYTLELVKQNEIISQKILKQ